MDKASDFGSEDCRANETNVSRMANQIGKTDCSSASVDGLEADDVSWMLQRVAVLRREAKNIRTQLNKMARIFQKSVDDIKSMLLNAPTAPIRGRNPDTVFLAPSMHQSSRSLETGEIWTQPVGFLRTCFPGKRGTPRQGSICPHARAFLRIRQEVFTNPSHAIMGLAAYSHVWIIFIFHLNEKLAVKAKVRPPRLDGEKVGVFASRSPHRPNPIGITLARLDSIEGETLHLSGIDVVDGTPVLDIKPFIPEYDALQDHCGGSTLPAPSVCSGLQETNEGKLNVSQTCLSIQDPCVNQQVCSASVADWVQQPPLAPLSVHFTLEATQDLERLAAAGALPILGNAASARHTLEAILASDPRCVYRRHRHPLQPFSFALEGLIITCHFGEGFAEVVTVCRDDDTLTKWNNLSGEPEDGVELGTQQNNVS
uniref:tRNA (adenine(37)-N6)-methyltransferase-like n=1 Tax=Myxine glutinosa TaxID=7769 RepID=UPI00358FA082